MPRFTAETAVIAAKLSHAPTSARNALPVVIIEPEVLPQLSQPANEPAESYRLERLVCLRAQLAKLDAMIAVETDPQKLDRLANAQAKVSVQEQNYAFRPGPGHLRPSAKGSKPQVHAIPEPIRKPESM